MQDRLRDVIEEKREIEIEFVALKKNYLTCNVKGKIELLIYNYLLKSVLEQERSKNENIGIELINIVNENKVFL